MLELAKQLKDANSLMFFARGNNYATALEAALKVRAGRLVCFAAALPAGCLRCLQPARTGGCVYVLRTDRDPQPARPSLLRC